MKPPPVIAKQSLKQKRSSFFTPGTLDTTPLSRYAFQPIRKKSLASTRNFCTASYKVSSHHGRLRVPVVRSEYRLGVQDVTYTGTWGTE